MNNIPEDVYGSLKYLKITDKIVMVHKYETFVNIYLSVPILSKSDLKVLSLVGSLIGIVPVEDEMIVLRCNYEDNNSK